MNEQSIVEDLKERLLLEFKLQDRSGVYGLTQRKMAYNSNRIEGSTLTERQTASMFETGYLAPDGDDAIFRAKDVEEMNGHFKMFNYMLETLEAPFSTDLIKAFHRKLKEGVFEDFANGYAIGDYKKRANMVGNIHTALPKDVPAMMEELVQDFNGKKNITLEDIAKFHADFEKIHPFQDGNGRVGRIIQDVSKAQYYFALEAAQNSGNLSPLTNYFVSQQNEFAREFFPFVFEFEETIE